MNICGNDTWRDGACPRPRAAARAAPTGGLRLFGFDRDRPAEAPAIVVTHHARDLGKEGVVLASAHVDAWEELGAALAHEDRPARNVLAAERLHAQALGVRVAAVAGRALTFLVCHGGMPLLAFDRFDADFDPRLAVPLGQAVL